MDGTGPLRRYEDMKEYLDVTNSFLNKDTLPENMVIATQFLCIRKSDSKLVGMIQVRHYFNEFLELYGGNIGYSVRPSERRRGYATWMLHNILPFCRSVGLEKVLVSCIDTNEGSRKTILTNGGVYDKTVNFKDSNVNLERYWIDLNEQENFETEHLILRKAKPEDTEYILKNVWSDESIPKYMLWKPACTKEEAEDRMKRTMNYQKSAMAYFVCLKETDEPIGFCGIKEVSPGVYEDSGICIASKYQRHGYGKEIVNVLLYIAFNLFGGKEFIYSCWKENIPSASLAKSLGFKYTHSLDEVREWDGMKYTVDYFSITEQS